MDSYNKTVWVNGANPPINAENLNHIESGIEAVTNEVIDTDKEIVAARGSYTDLKERLDHTGAPTDEQVTEAVEDYLDKHPVSGAEKYVEVTDTSDTAVDNCTDPDTAYIVRVVSGVVSTARMRVVCSPNVAGALAQYGFSKDGYIITRKYNGSEWSAWDFIPNSSRVALMISTAIDEEISGVYENINIFDRPADGTAQADFNAENICADDVYNYLNDLIEGYPQYISKEILGKDSSGNYDINRYVLFSGQYLAYEKENYPKMYAWKNGSAVIYSPSVSPRIGDTLYSTTYIGTSAGTVSAVDNANETRTVGGTVYTRDKTSDVKPTLLFCRSIPDGYGKMPGVVGCSLYNSSNVRVGSIATNATDSQGRQVITYGDGSAGNYTRQPFYDTNSLTERPNTIVIIANEHGPDYDPAEPAIICCRIMKRMCEATGDEFIRFLRSCKVVFIPVANPWGFNTKKYSLINRYNLSSSYMNYNGRNFHRNFDTKGWTYSGEGSTEKEAQATSRDACYGGSEIETQYLMDTMYGATLGFAIHCMPTTENSQGSMIVQSEDISADENFKALTAELWGKYQMFLTHSTDCDPNSYSKPSSYAIANCTNGGAMFEMNRRIRYTLPMHDSKILRADYQEMAGIVKIFAKRAGIWPESGYPDGDEVDW